MLESLVSILGLVSIFKSERKSTSDDENQAFIEWLLHSNHKNIVEEINTNHKLGLSIKILLQQNHSDLLKTLKSVDSSIALLTSKIDGVSDISHAIYPSIDLSEQAISILKQLNESGGSFFLEAKRMAGAIYAVMDGVGNKVIEIKEPRFVDDDLNQLVHLGLLRLDYNSKGGKLFYFTRSAIKLLEQVD